MSRMHRMTAAGLLAFTAASALVAQSAPPVSNGNAVSPPPANVRPRLTQEPWAYESTDVIPDPAVHFGRLPNGMRYLILRNTIPHGEARMALRIAAGSLMENDQQLGLAHFMEHMVFNGTRHYPEGDLVKTLERLGLAFGADTNAYTSFDETVYMLNLPNAEARIFDPALAVMRDAAGEALLNAGAINRERGVVLSEERTRGGAGYRSSIALLNFLLKGQLIGKRMPIGSIKVIETAPREQLVDFYTKYYRPENATLIVTGDVDVAQTERKIRERFGDWQPSVPAGAEPDIGQVAKRGLDTEVFVETGVAPTLRIDWAQEPKVKPETMAQRRRNWKELLARYVFNRRLQRASIRDDAPFLSAEFGVETFMKAADLTTLTATFAPDGWRPAVAALEQEQRRIVQYGVTRAELDRAITTYRETLKNLVAQANTATTSDRAGTLLRAVSRNEVLTTAAQRSAMFEEVVKDLDVREVSDILRGYFTGNGPLLFMTNPEPIENGKAALRSAFQQSRRVAVTASVDTTAIPWPYRDFGAPGRVVERREVPDLGTTLIRFANGVRLNVRPNPTQKNGVNVALSIGHGQLGLPTDRPTAAWAASQAFIQGGLGKMTVEQLDDALATISYGASLGVGDESFVLSGSTRPRDLATQMEVLTAFVTDPGWRTQGLERAKQNQISTILSNKSTPTGVVSEKLGSYLRSGDPRFASPTVEAVRATTMADLRGILRPVFTDPIEVAITGDVTVEEAIRQTARTLGALPPRKETPLAANAAAIRFPAGGGQPLRLTHQGRADQALAIMAWPSSDFPSDPQKARAANALAAVMRLRLLDEVREKEGITYSPGSTSSPSWAYPNFGVLLASVQAVPSRIDPFFTTASKIARGLRDRPVTADELQRAIGPMISSAQRAREFDDYWLDDLANAQSDPRQLQALRDDITGLQRITPADVQRVAREYLRDDRAVRIEVLPEARTQAASASASAPR